MPTPIFDVVQHIRPGAPCSTEAGRWLVTSRSNEIGAAGDAAKCRMYCLLPDWITYTVERHDRDECPGRAVPYRDRAERTAGECTCATGEPSDSNQ